MPSRNRRLRSRRPKNSRFGGLPPTGERKSPALRHDRSQNLRLGDLRSRLCDLAFWLLERSPTIFAAVILARWRFFGVANLTCDLGDRRVPSYYGSRAPR